MSNMTIQASYKSDIIIVARGVHKPCLLRSESRSPISTQTRPRIESSERCRLNTIWMAIGIFQLYILRINLMDYSVSELVRQCHLSRFSRHHCQYYHSFRNVAGASLSQLTSLETQTNVSLGG